MTRPYVFISYSQQDKEEKERLLAHLDVLQQAGYIEVWSDDQLGPGAAWRAEITLKIRQAKIAVLLITPNFLSSDFINREMLPLLRQQHQRQQLIIVPLIARACHWPSFTWLAEMSVRPKGGRPVWDSAGSHVDEDLAAIAQEIAEIIDVDQPDFTSAAPLLETSDGLPPPPPLHRQSPAEKPKTVIELPPGGLEQFGPNYIHLLQKLYPEVKRVLLQQEIGGGWGGARVLLVQAIAAQHKPLARQIVKISRGPELKAEYDNYYQRVGADLPVVAAKVTRWAEFKGLSGIIYSFMGDRSLGHTQTLEAYYQEVSAEQIIQTLETLLQAALGQAWYNHTEPHIRFFEQEYGRHLAEHLRLKLRPDSDDGLWPVEQAPAPGALYKPLTGQTIRSDYRKISAGTLVYIEGFCVSKVKANELKLQPPDPQNVGLVVKVEYSPQSEAALTFAVGNKVVVCGEVLYNRQSRLEDVVQQSFSDFSAATVAVEQETLNWGPDYGYPNPLQLYPDILDRTLFGKKSRVHGDLHLRNVLVDQDGRGWLIDFARVAERHNLYDFIKLETYIRQMILGREKYQFPFTAYLQFEEALAAASLGQSAAPPDQPDLQKAYRVIQSLRQIAAHYMGYPVDFYAEYFPALFLYNLAVVKYHENHGAKATRLAFATAAVVGRALTQAKPEPKPAQEFKPKPASPPIQAPEAAERQIATKTQPPLSLEDESFLREQLAAHEQNLRLLLRQKIVYAAGEEPLRLLNQIRAEEQAINDINKQLGQ